VIALVSPGEHPRRDAGVLLSPAQWLRTAQESVFRLIANPPSAFSLTSGVFLVMQESSMGVIDSAPAGQFYNHRDILD
jgi:hypothetical protein